MNYIPTLNVQLPFHRRVGPKLAGRPPLVSPAAGEGWPHGDDGMTAVPARQFSYMRERHTHTHIHTHTYTENLQADQTTMLIF